MNKVVNESADAVAELADSAKLLSSEAQRMAPIYDILKRL